MYGAIAFVLYYAALAFILLAFSAHGQTPTPRPNVPLLRTGGIYSISCHGPTDADLAQICFVRTDLTEPEELGCVTAAPDTDVRLDLNLVETTGDDAEIRCYAVDDSGLVSDYSLNAGLVDFTRPGLPYVK